MNTNLNCGVYRIENLATGRSYYGSSENIKTRWLHHVSQLRGNSHYNIELQKDWNFYTEKNFKFSILFYCDPEVRTFFEDRFIKANPTSYNIYMNNSYLIGQKFGHVTVLSFDRYDNSGRSYWLCEYESGKKRLFRIDNLKKLPHKSIGKKEVENAETRYDLHLQDCVLFS